VKVFESTFSEQMEVYVLNLKLTVVDLDLHEGIEYYEWVVYEFEHKIGHKLVLVMGAEIEIEMDRKKYQEIQDVLHAYFSTSLFSFFFLLFTTKEYNSTRVGHNLRHRHRHRHRNMFLHLSVL
jgi:hypothetical protein